MAAYFVVVRNERACPVAFSQHGGARSSLPGDLVVPAVAST